MSELREYALPHKGLELAVLEYGPPDAEPLLALHGWRDNAASFAPLAAAMPQYRWIAPDFPGHGKSAHRHPQASYCIWTYLEEVLALLDHLALPGITVTGHSMGGAVGCLLAAVYPEYCSRLVLLDSVGPLATAPADTRRQMRESFDQLRTRKLAWRHHYADKQSAVDARCGKGLSRQASLLLAERGVAMDERGYYWNLDTRLGMRNPLSLSEEHARELLGSITCPVLLVAAKAYWQGLGKTDGFGLRQGYFKQLESHVLAGSHHQHMEAEVSQVAQLVQDFLERQRGTS
jgi:pimeloyl-ACP methyl ester carboxylesterase